jgi:hypothetical protein
MTELHPSLAGGVLHDPDIRPEVAERLGCYVYLYIDPRDEKPFYVGKGKGGRALSHLSAAAESRKCAKLNELRSVGLKPRIDILAHGLRDEETAFRVEAAVIDLFGLDALTNEVRGWRSLQLGRIPLSELTTYYAAKPVDVIVAALLIRINRLYRHNMTPEELYEATRGVWKLGARCGKARYAFAVFEGVVREVYEIESWHAAATTPYLTRDAAQLTTNGRREFTGRVADAAVRDAYVGGSVSDQFRPGSQSPVLYVNC